VGSGNISLRHFKLAKELIPRAEIRRLRRVHSIDSSGDLPEDIFSIDDAISFAPQLAVICNPSTNHLEFAEIMSQLGAHLLIEKPLAHSTEGVIEFLERCDDRGSLLLLGYNLRFSQSLKFFRDSIMSNLVGRPISVRCEVGQYLPNWRPNRDYRSTVSARKEFGGGVLLELSHELDYLRWIFGEISWVRATFGRFSELEIDVEDTALLTLGFANVTSNHLLIASLNMDFVRHDTTRVCTVIGEKGSLRWDGIRGRVSLFEQGAEDWSTLYSKESDLDDSYREEWLSLLKSVDENTSSEIVGHDGLRVLQIIEAAHASAFDGRQTVIRDY
jgi:predicted dehydrogenase